MKPHIQPKIDPLNDVKSEPIVADIKTKTELVKNDDNDQKKFIPPDQIKQEPIGE